MKRLQVKLWRLVITCTLSYKIFPGGGIDIINPKSYMIPGVYHVG